MVAGFMAGWMEKQDYEHAFHMGCRRKRKCIFRISGNRPEVEAVYKQR